MKFSWPPAIVLLAAMSLVRGFPAFAAAEGAGPVARIGTETISAQELAARTSEKLEKQQAAYEARVAQLKQSDARERQAVLEKELNILIDERVLLLEAAARNSTPTALMSALKTPEVTAQQIRELYEAKKTQINQPFDAVAPQIKDYLEKQANERAHRAYLTSLREKYRVVELLEPYRAGVAATGPQRGPSGTPVAIVEFSDFQCPFCGRFEPVIRDVLKKYPTQVRLIYRHYPLSELHPNAQKAAEAAVCAQDQGKFWEMHDLLFAEQAQLDVGALKDKANRLGLDTKKFDTCLDSGKATPAVRLDVTAGDLLGLSGTPATFVNGRFIEGDVSIEVLSSIIDDELRRAALVARR